MHDIPSHKRHYVVTFKSVYQYGVNNVGPKTGGTSKRKLVLRHRLKLPEPLGVTLAGPLSIEYPPCAVTVLAISHEAQYLQNEGSSSGFLTSSSKTLLQALHLYSYMGAMVSP
jgi:hypothetical protein